LNGPRHGSAHEPAARHDGPLSAHADTFARLALANVTREYPNSPAQRLDSPEELVPPRTYRPAFYGAYDWHSSVHMHWLLMRLLGHYRGSIDARAVTEALDAHLTPSALAAESGCLRANPSFERPYGWAWLLMLTAESNALGTQRWTAALTPAARTVAQLVVDWLPKADYPVRHGTHTNSAFALGLMLDSAEAIGAPELVEPVEAKLLEWFLHDYGGSPRWEPSGQDFLSPLLCEADAMRRVLPAGRFADWLAAFLPELSGSGPFLTPPRLSDPADPQIGHLRGLCLSRAAALRHIAAALPDGDDRVRTLAADADAHVAVGLQSGVASGDFMTDHWLATFAALALEAAVAG
jgi:hypothetical protein